LLFVSSTHFILIALMKRESDKLTRTSIVLCCWKTVNLLIFPP
jgi:hypothetical protein